MNKVKLLNIEALKKSLSEKLQEVIYARTDRKPIIIPIFMDVATDQSKVTIQE